MTTPATLPDDLTTNTPAEKNAVNAEALFKMQSARTQLILDQPFFGVLALRLELHEDNSQPSGYTNGQVLGYNAAFVNALPRLELLGFICHEVMHCSMGHIWRRGGRHHQKFNLSCVAPSTRITLANGSQQAIQAIRAGEFIQSPVGVGQILMKTAGTRDIIQLVFTNGTTLELSPQHEVLTDEGFITAGEIKKGAACLLDTGNGRPTTRDAYNPLTHRDRHGNGFSVFTGCQSDRQESLVETASFQGDASIDEARYFDGTGLGLSSRDRRWGRHHFYHTEREGEQVHQATPHHFQHIEHSRDMAGGARVQSHVVKERSWESVLEDYHIRVEGGQVVDAVAALFENQEAACTTIAALDRTARTTRETLHRNAGNGTYFQGHQDVEYTRVAAVSLLRRASPVFDLVTTSHSFYANGVATHNCDFAINFLVDGAGYKIPADFNNRKPEFDGKSAEWIYNRLPPVVKLKLSAQDLRDGDESGNKDGVAEADWEMATQQAAQVAKMQGKLPASIERFCKLNAQSKVDWKSVLHRFVQQVCKSDYTWRRPSTRYLPSGLYLPSLRDEQMGAIAIGVDTSGSVDELLLNEFATNVQSIIDSVHPVKTYVIYCDAKVHRIDEFGPDEPITMKLVGGGGTDFRPVFEALPKLEEQPVCLVYLTDLMGTFPSKHDIPVLWATPNQKGMENNFGHVPFGEVVYIS